MDKPAIAPPVFVFQKDKAQKRSAEGSSAEDGEDSDKEEGSYCPPVKRERTSSFPPPHSVPKNNVFMPSSFCQSPTGNSDSEPEEKPVGFRLKPPTLIHGQAPSSATVTKSLVSNHLSDYLALCAFQVCNVILKTSLRGRRDNGRTETRYSS
uniref:Uncharacterized protein n=1 Tax=Gouania willdenowi TaxID=441366 RepID=A0A8C5GH44_GOUWI